MPIIDPNSYIPHCQSPTETPPKNSNRYFPLLASTLVVILSAYLLSFRIFPAEEEKMSLDQNIAMDIGPQYSMRASSLREGIFSTTACLSLINPSHVSREPLDLAFVIDIPRARDPRNIEAIQYAISDALPLLGDKDRLLTLIFDEESGSMYNYVPLARTTEENKNTIFSNLGEEFSGTRSNSAYQGLRTAIKFLNQRKSSNSVPGIILHTQKCDQSEINEILQGLKSPNGGSIPHTFVFCSEPKGSEIPFQANMEELQSSIIGNSGFFVKPEDSALLHGVEIVKTQFKEYEDYGKIHNRMFIGQNVSLFPMRQRCFAVDVKIPNPAPLGLALFKRGTRVKIASFEMIFASVGGQTVIKNEDYSIGIERVVMEELEL